MHVPWRSPQLSGGLLELRPGLIAELGLPVGIEAGLAERLPEGGSVDLQELHAFGRKIGTKRLAQPGDIGTLVIGRAIEFAGDDFLQILRQLLEGALVAE